MAITYINTVETVNIGKEVVDLANQFSNEINDLYNRLSEVEYVTKEWVGTQANYYFKHVINDKKQYIEFANALKEIGYKIVNDTNNIQLIINQNNKNELLIGESNE